MDTITTDTAKSILRVMLAQAAARIIVSTISTLHEMEAPLTEIQQQGIVAAALMDYRTTCEDAEDSVDAEVVLNHMRVAVNAALPPKWATEDEARQEWRERTNG
jgi:hypothetical protein